MTFLDFLQHEALRKDWRKAVISCYKWLRVECPKNNYTPKKPEKIVPLRQPCFTGGGPSGAARIAAKHNTGKVAGFVCPSPIGRLNTKQENKANPHNSQLTEVKDPPSLSALFTPFVLYGPHFLSQQVSQPVDSPSANHRSVKLAQQAVCVSRTIWHDIMQAPPSQIIRNTRQQTPAMTFPHLPTFEEPTGCYYGMIVTQPWKRQFDVGAEWWCSLSLRSWAVVQDSVSNTCLLFTDHFSTTTRSRGLETPALPCQD